MLNRLLAAAVLVGALSGCADDTEPGSVRLQLDDIAPDSTGSRTLYCGVEAHISIGVSSAIDSGSLTVKVREGSVNQVPVFHHVVKPDQAGSVEEDLAGNTGDWTLIIDRSLEYDTPTSVTLSC